MDTLHAFILVLLIALTSPGVGGADLRAVDLRCEYQANPLAVDAAPPRLSWVLRSIERGQTQTAYQILVASNVERLEPGQADLWDSGRVASSEQNQIPYAGRALGSNQECCWKVRGWDRHGEPGAWSEPARWTMGLVKPEDWKAAWIGSGPFRTSEPLPLFRRSSRGQSGPARRRSPLRPRPV